MSAQPEIDAVAARALVIANGIVQGELDPYPGGKLLWRLHDALAILEGSLSAFVGIGAEWEDEKGDWRPPPDRRAELERDIVAAADRFRARFGP